MTLKVFPYALVRYAAMPFSALKALEITEADACLAAADIAAQDFRQQQEHLCERLYQAIQSAADDSTRQLLLRWKRAVYNGRKPPAETVDYLQEPMQLYRELLAQQQQDREAWQSFYDRQLLQHRRQLQEWSTQEALRKGILLSSPVLYGQLDHFAAADPAAFKARELKNEYSLLRYITRMAAKTSPFSTFTYTGISKLQAAPDSTPAIISSIRLNNSLFTYLRSLLVHHPVLNELMIVTLNDTVTADDTHLHFLVNYFNVEAFQRLPARNVALWLYQQLKVPCTLAALIDTLAGEMPGVAREQIKAFLLKLSASGLLELGIGCSGIDPEWDRALMDFLSGDTLQHEAADALRKLLLQLQVNRRLYAAADAATRAQLLEASAAALNTVLHQLQTEAALPDIPTASAGDTVFEVHHFAPRHFQPSDIFYEDAFAPAAGGLSDAVQILAEKAERCCALLASSDPLQPERNRMRDFFLQQYDAAQQPAVTDFYHAYYLHVKKQQPDSESATAMAIPETMQLRVQPGVIDITAPSAAPTAPLSRGMFVQLFHPDTTAPLMGVVNAFLPGMGKVAGRFLHLFEPAVTAAFQSWNTALHPEHLMVELNDGSVFNANIHPPLLAHEITIPGGSNNYPSEKRISLKDIVVRYDPACNRLGLWHTVADKPVYTFDLCLESFYNRSHFYRLLAHFNPAARVPLRHFIAAADRHYSAVYDATVPVQLLPRIVFEGGLVLRRKGWLVGTAAVPAQGHAETEAEYFLRLQRWRIAEGLPQQVFVFLKSPYLQVPAKKGQLHRDDYKPQYISFVQPLLVAVFRKMLNRAGEQIYLEEVLPDASSGGAVTEHMLHWYQY